MRYSIEHLRDYQEHYKGRPQQVVPIPHHEQVHDLAGKLHVESILDYGSGPAKALEHFSPLKVHSYDPIFENKVKRADMVVCHHVLEHVEPDYLTSVLNDIRDHADRCAYLVVSLQASTKKLPSGDDWHKIVESPEWWQERFTEIFPGIAPIPTVNDNEYAAFWVR